MGRKYTKGEELSKAIRARNAAGETNRAIGESYGLSKRQVEQLISRQNRKGRPRKEAASEEVRQHNELAKLRMQVELLQNFLSEAGCQQAIYKYSNRLNRRFDQPRPNQFWGADRTGRSALKCRLRWSLIRSARPYNRKRSLIKYTLI